MENTFEKGLDYAAFKRAYSASNEDATKTEMNIAWKRYLKQDEKEAITKHTQEILHRPRFSGIAAARANLDATAKVEQAIIDRRIAENLRGAMEDIESGLSYIEFKKAYTLALPRTPTVDEIIDE